MGFPVKDVSLVPEVHLFVCTNRRPDTSPLGPGCASEGEELFDDLKLRTLTTGLTSRVWVTRTGCLGICPKAGVTVACYPVQRFFEARATDGAALLTRALSASKGNE